MLSRLRADTFTAILALALALYIAYEGRELGLGSVHDPGSGYIQFWTGVIMAGLAVALLVQSLLPGAERTGVGEVFRGIMWGKVLYVTALLIAYTFVLETLGFILTTFILLVILFKTVEPQSWTVSIIGSVLTTATAWLVFVYWLGTQMPPGSLFGDG
jgi:putative tricarboxylic transport membrane protein